MTISLIIYGKQSQAGSKTGYGFKRKDGSIGVNIKDDAKHHKTWMSTVANVAREQYDGPVLDVPMRFDVVFEWPRRKSHYGTGRNAHTLRDSAPIYPALTPDEDKMSRAIRDALKGVIYTDDKLIVEGSRQKRWVEITEPYKTMISITPFELVTLGDLRRAQQLKLAA